MRGDECGIDRGAGSISSRETVLNLSIRGFIRRPGDLEPAEVIPLALTTLITGAAASGGAIVVNVKSEEICKFPAASFDFTR